MSAVLKPPVGARDHLAGSVDAPVVLVEYGDYECPYCGEAYPIVKELADALSDKLCLVFRNFPLSSMHPHAMRAAQAAEAAGAQGRFWQMHDLLFENQEALDEGDLVVYAKTLDLDVEQFRRDLAAGLHEARVREDFASGVRSGVNGTPTFFINGRRHDGSYQLDELLQAVEAALAESPRKGGRARK